MTDVVGQAAGIRVEVDVDRLSEQVSKQVATHLARLFPSEAGEFWAALCDQAYRERRRVARCSIWSARTTSSVRTSRTSCPASGLKVSDVNEAQMVRLVPHRWTTLPGTGVVVRWDGEQVVTVTRLGEFWNLAPLAVPGRVLAWARLADRPELGAWPVVSIASGSIYRSGRRAYRCMLPDGRP